MEARWADKSNISPNKEMLFFFQRYRWNHLVHIHSYKSGPSTGLRLSNCIPFPSRDAVSCPRCDSSQGRERSRTAEMLSQAGERCSTLKPPAEPCQDRLSSQRILYLPCLLIQPAPHKSCARTPMPCTGRELLSLSNTFSLAAFPSLRLPGAKVCASWSWHKHELNLVLWI